MVDITNENTDSDQIAQLSSIKNERFMVEFLVEKLNCRMKVDTGAAVLTMLFTEQQ